MKVPSEVSAHNKRRELELVYPDGTRFEFPYEFLRVFSPSADVTGHTPDQAKLQVGKRDVMVKGIKPVGTYALQLVFSDGHDTGVYTFDYFEELGQTKEARWALYLEDLRKAGASRDPDDPANKPFLEAAKPKMGCGH